MKYLGKIRVDNLNRILIPSELRHSWKLKKGSAMELHMFGSALIVKSVCKESKGFVRFVDSVGRVTVPKQFLEMMDMDDLHMFYEKKRVIVANSFYLLANVVAPVISTAVDKQILTSAEARVLNGLIERLREDDLVRMI